MRLYPTWSVLAPGSPTWVEQRARAALSIDYEEEELGVSIPSPFTLVPGTGHYHLLFSMDPFSVGLERVIAEAMSRECDEPVYAIMEADEVEWVEAYRSGTAETLDVEPGQLAQSLGCPFPEEPPAPEEPLLKRVALVEGIHIPEALRALEEEAGYPLPPGLFRFLEKPAGFVIAGGNGFLGFADITLSERFPEARVYSVTASPDLGTFILRAMQGLQTFADFAHPDHELRHTLERPVGAIKGASTPEGILAALGIPADWFR